MLLDKDKNIVINYANKERIIFDLSVVKDKKPKIEILSAPNIVNESSLSFISKTTDDYGIKKIVLNIGRPMTFKHFEEEYLSFNLYLNNALQQSTKLVESYFYKYLADIVWAGDDAYFEIIQTDALYSKESIEKEITRMDVYYHSIEGDTFSAIRRDWFPNNYEDQVIFPKEILSS